MNQNVVKEQFDVKVKTKRPKPVMALQKGARFKKNRGPLIIMPIFFVPKI